MSEESKSPNEILKGYIKIAGSNEQTINSQEIEAVFGQKMRLSRIDFENVIGKLKSLDFNDYSYSGKHYLNIQNQYIDRATGKTRIGNIRTTINGIYAIQDYCKTNKINMEDATGSSQALVRFLQKIPKKHNNQRLPPIFYNDFGFKINYKEEKVLKPEFSIVRDLLNTWDQQKKVFRLIKRSSFTSYKFPNIRVDCSVIKSSKRVGNRLIPEFRIESSNVFNNPESYEIEIELVNMSSLTFNDAVVNNLMKQLKTCIKYVLSGLQGTNYPISITERNNILEQYMGILYKEVPDRRVRPRDFVGPSSISLERPNIAPLEDDINREKGIIIDANSNEKRLKGEKSELIEIDSKYYETEKKSNEDLNGAKSKLDSEIKIIKELLSSQKNNEAMDLLEKFKKTIEEYAISFSKNENIKKESIKRSERINIIDNEIESWKNLLSNSEKMVTELTERKNKLSLRLEKLDNQPKFQAEKKGQISEGLRISEKEKAENETIINNTDEKIELLRSQLNEIQEQSIQIRERKASSGATVEGLKKRKNDLVDRINSELNLTDENILENSNLFGKEELPDAVNQEDLLDKKKQERERLGSVNLKADEETNKYQIEIKKMEQDRTDLVTAITKLKESINELNQKGRERLTEAFDKVNRKFNEVYTQLFNGGSAKLELVDSDDPLEAGLEMLVSPPGKRLQSITLLSGGEQALTALSLVFAVFLTNPSPICVLDEVDAPLDDANVTRFCNLLEELIKITNTKFIIVTHHALTMSKMNRLYGVTMPEKGISQLVAVDLQKAERMVA